MRLWRGLCCQGQYLPPVACCVVCFEFAFDDDTTGMLDGECASVGTYEGVVRVVRDSSDNDRMNLGDVMVAPSPTEIRCICIDCLFEKCVW